MIGRLLLQACDRVLCAGEPARTLRRCRALRLLCGSACGDRHCLLRLELRCQNRAFLLRELGALPRVAQLHAARCVDE